MQRSPNETLQRTTPRLSQPRRYGKREEDEVVSALDFAEKKRKKPDWSDRLKANAKKSLSPSG
jgi:hypothetical protein